MQCPRRLGSSRTFRARQGSRHSAEPRNYASWVGLAPEAGDPQERRWPASCWEGNRLREQTDGRNAKTLLDNAIPAALQISEVLQVSFVTDPEVLAKTWNRTLVCRRKTLRDIWDTNSRLDRVEQKDRAVSARF